MTSDITREQLSAIIVDRVKPRLQKNSTPHIIMMVLKSYGVNTFVSRDQIAFIAPRADTYRLCDILKRPIDRGYITKSKNTYALTPLGNHVLYNIAEHKPGPDAGRGKEGTEGLLTTEELIEIDSDS